MPPIFWGKSFFIWIFLLSLMFPSGGLCGGREEVLANGWTLDLLIERFNQCQEKAIAHDLEHPPSKNWGGGHIYAGYSVWLKNWATAQFSNGVEERLKEAENA
ncbi:MAG: hypothetical protein PHS50_15320 [Kiritimatiellae bacterium]|nr:hypothetical protein [Kiritimatiellia bacterium]